MKLLTFLHFFAEYGSPEELISTTPKVSNFVTLKLINANTRQATIRRVSRNITVMTLKALANKLLGNSSDKEPYLKYIDNENNIEVEMDSETKTLDFYSIQDGNSVIIEWK